MTLKVSSGKFRGDKIEYHDGIGCSIWEPFPRDEDNPDETDDNWDDQGIVFDFSYDAIDDLIILLGLLKLADATKYVEQELPIYADERIVKDEKYGRSIVDSPAVKAYEKKKNYDMKKILDMMGVDDLRKIEEKMTEPFVEAVKEFNEKYGEQQNADSSAAEQRPDKP